MAKKCMSCDLAYPESENFCIECGSKLVAAEDTEDTMLLKDKMDRLEYEISMINDKMSSLKPVRIPEGLKDIDTKSLDAINKKIDALSRRLANMESMPEPPLPTLSTKEWKIDEKTLRGLYHEFEKTESLLKDVREEGGKRMEDMELEINSIKSRIDQFKETEDMIKKLDIRNVSREIELLKTKINWLQDSIEKVNIKKLYDKIEELEHKILLAKASSALIIE